MGRGQWSEVAGGRGLDVVELERTGSGEDSACYDEVVSFHAC